ncbi:MAG: nucleotide exchange factor GrpE [Woeseiaceae bacterium]|nr:nucleotide exchange factor GrpE [Woeseiaceae bacterium]
MTGQPDRTGTEPAEKDAAEDATTADATGPDAGDEREEHAEGEASELDKARALADENWDKYLRAMAELENVRKRAARDVERARRFALEQFARELLAVRDSLEMGLQAAAGEGGSADALYEGSEATLKQLASTMEQFGIVELDPHGEPFDPEQHEAMTTQPSAEVEPGTVLTVFQKGYALNGRLLRPARVVVAREGDDNG